MSSADLDRVRTLLQRDPIWSLYLLGDLEPHLRDQCHWWSNDEAVVLLYVRFDPPVLLAAGPAEMVRPLLRELPHPPALHLHIRPEVLPLVEERYAVAHPVTMVRMGLDPARFQGRRGPHVVPLGPGDADAVARLYRDGDATGEAPDFYSPEMLEHGLYFGVWEAGDLIAVAGTHLVGHSESVAALGNVYTRRDRRGRALAAETITAVVDALSAAGVRTIGLSVKERNRSARSLYRRLGFADHCPFVEGRAVALKADAPTR